jgi:hypothetical protein
MKKVFYISAILIGTMACQTQQNQNEKADSTAVDDVPMVGGDQDKHGCKGSAGYTWSTVKNNCIRVFEEGIRLNPLDSTLNQTVSAFVVFANEANENEGESELFLPTLTDSSLILKPLKDNGAGSWSNGTYLLTQWKGMYTLAENKKTLYQGNRQ